MSCYFPIRSNVISFSALTNTFTHKMSIPGIVESEELIQSLSTENDKSSVYIPSRGLIDYLGQTSVKDTYEARRIATMNFLPSTSSWELLKTRFNLWRQLPWKKIDGKVVLKVKIEGDISLEAAVSPTIFSGSSDLEKVTSVSELCTLFQFAAHDPRIQAILVDISRVSCGFAKLTEIRRSMNYFTQSGKLLYGYCNSGSEKEYFLSLGCDKVFVPPEGGFDLRGFSASVTFIREFLEKIGIEPQVQRIGKLSMSQCIMLVQ